MIIRGRTPGDLEPTPETQAFWDAAADGRFLVRHCSACGKAHWYPRSVCPLCHSSDTEWRAASGAGTIYSFSVMRKAEPPFVMAYVTLAEGPTMMTNIVECDSDALAIGQPVELVFQPSKSGIAVPCFQPLKPA
jgi:uncharacterized OB-fold protein